MLLALAPGALLAAVDQGITCPSSLSRNIPARAADALNGAGFADLVAHQEGKEREGEIQREILSGNLPAFLRRLKPVKLKGRSAMGRQITATLCVMPDYLAIGDDRDFLRIPMDLHSATEVASHFGFVLPTPRMVDAIYRQSVAHLTPQPMQAGPQMRSTDYYRRHNRSIREQRNNLGVGLDALIAGHKKDVVISNRLASHPGRIAIYGWHKPDGKPIQPLSTVHGVGYADYSHGVRLVSDVVYLDGQPASLHAVLEDKELSPILSSEGPVAILSRLIPESPDLQPLLGLSSSGTARHGTITASTAHPQSPAL